MKPLEDVGKMILKAMEENAEEKLKRAIQLLEMAYYKVHIGASFVNNKLSLIEDLQSKKEIAEFVKSIKKDSKLKVPKIETYRYSAA